MKNKLLIFSILILCTSSCNYLEYDESDFLEKDAVFSSFQYTRDFLTNIYSYVPAAFGTIGGDALRSAACDEAVYVDKLSPVHSFNNGAWSAINTLDDRWNYFRGIRAVNMFLQEVEGQEFDELKHNEDYEDIMAQFKYYPYEARFLRAYFYFELAKRYGDIPLITTLLSEEEANMQKRTSFDEVIQFIVDECDAIAPHLPISYKELIKSETGRATRGAAMALKSRALLYSASPLFNKSGNIDKWKSAARAAADVIEKAWDFGYMPLPDLWSLWNNNYSNNNELIFGVMQREDNWFERVNFPIGIEGGGNTGHCPTENLVESYEMQASGLPVAPDAGYEHMDPSYDSQNPYEGRDPRMYELVAQNGAWWVYDEQVECWYGGRSGKPQKNATVTGYYLRKYVDGSTSLKSEFVTSKRHVWNIMRYSEILLNFAEAMVEAYGDPNYKDGYPMSAKEAVDIVRSRVHVDMPPFPNNLTLNEFKAKLRNERRVELSFEDHRFWDIRRWKIADQTTDIYGVDITKKEDGSFRYKKVFKGVEHRLEKVCRVKGVDYINDSKATNVNSCWYALQSMKTKTVLILGGKDKGNDYNEIADLVKEKCVGLIYMGLHNEKLHEFFDPFGLPTADVQSMKDAVDAAYRMAKKGESVLLSPCCASFDLFKSYEDRGEQFKDCVRAL